MSDLRLRELEREWMRTGTERARRAYERERGRHGHAIILSPTVERLLLNLEATPPPARLLATIPRGEDTSGLELFVKVRGYTATLEWTRDGTDVAIVLDKKDETSALTRTDTYR